MKTTYTNRQKLQRLTTAAILAALSIVLMMAPRFPLFTNFYEMEFSDIPILICASVVGPVYAIVSLFIVCLIQSLTVSAPSGYIGFIMHFLSSGLMILVMFFVRKHIDGLKGIIVSSLLSVLMVVIVMIPMNIWLTSVFMKLPVTEFLKGFLGVCIAFNGVKAGSNVIIFNILSPAIIKAYKKLFNKA